MSRPHSVIHRVARVSSTQDEARERFRSGRAMHGHVIVADEQTAGRGRFGRRWLSPAGGLYATFLIAPSPAIGLAVGVAVARALERWGIPVGLKWPNDVLWNRRKLAGILVEAEPDVAFVGIGINLTGSPIETAASLDEIGTPIRRGELLLALGEELGAPQDPPVLLAAYRERSITLGHRVRVVAADGTAIEGRAVDVGPNGELIVETSSGIEKVTSGECEHLDALDDGSDRP